MHALATTSSRKFICWWTKRAFEAKTHISIPLSILYSNIFVGKMADQIKLQLSKLRIWLDKYPAMKVLEEKTHVPKEYAVCGAGVLVFLFLLFSNGAGFLW